MKPTTPHPPLCRIVPDGWQQLAVSGSARREIETLALLGASLPEGYTVFHAVHWTNIEQHYAIFGEIDFAVVNRAGDLLLIEQKSGFLDETADGLVRRQAGRNRSVPVQLSRMVGAFRAKLGARPELARVRVDALLYCPDYRVKEPHTAGLDPERIVDASRREQFAQLIQEILPLGDAQPAAARMHRFLADLIQLEPDVSALMGRARQMVTRVSGGLAHWARQLDFQPFRLRVVGTAGSGKTQLALAEYQATLAAGRRPLYLSFNRPLADHFASIAPAGGMVATFHQLCDRRLRHAGHQPDFSGPKAFDNLFVQAAQLPLAGDFQFDTLIVDEGQDFSQSWLEFILSHARADARLLWLEDPMQNLYSRPGVSLPGWVTLHAQRNYRSPRPIVHLLQAIVPPDIQLEAASPLAFDEIDFIPYSDGADLQRAAKEAVRNCYAAGFKKHDLVLLSYHGRDRSKLLGLDHLGSHQFKRYTGAYDLLGQPLYSDGDILLESIYRFKGQSAPAVILAEVDFASLDDAAVRKLFVGATRAMARLVVVIQEDAYRQLRLKLEA